MTDIEELMMDYVHKDCSAVSDSLGRILDLGEVVIKLKMTSIIAALTTKGITSEYANLDNMMTLYRLDPSYKDELRDLMTQFEIARMTGEL